MRLSPASPPWPRPVRAELETTGWERYPIVDIVTYAPATSRGLEGDRQRIEVYRHRAAPPISRYQTEERTARVERVTRPLYQRYEDTSNYRFATASSMSSRGTG